LGEDYLLFAMKATTTKGPYHFIVSRYV
jgi:hypothetical protein